MLCWEVIENGYLELYPSLLNLTVENACVNFMFLNMYLDLETKFSNLYKNLCKKGVLVVFEPICLKYKKPVPSDELVRTTDCHQEILKCTS